MSITVAQAMSFGGLVHSRVLAGSRNLSNIIDGVDVIEVPCEPDWESSSKNILHITTFFAVKEDVASQIKTIEMLAGWNCSALVVQLSILGKVPQPVIECAENLGLPLLEIPGTVSYIDLITPIVGAILKEKTELLQRSEEIHRKLTDISLSGGGFPAIISALRDLIDHPVAIIDQWGSMIASVGFELPNLRILDLIRKDYWRFELTDTEPTYISDYGIWLMQLFPGGQHQNYGFIVVCDPARDIDTLGLLAIEQTSIITALEVAKQNAVLETERKLQQDFFEKLLCDKSISKDELISRAATLGWDLSDKHIIALIDLDPLEDSFTRSNLHREQDYESFKAHFLNVFTGMVKESDPLAIVVDQSEKVIFLPHYDPQKTKNLARPELQKVAESTITRMKTQGYDLNLVIGFGGFRENIWELKKSYAEALMALEVGKRLSLKQPVVWYEDLILFILLERLGNQPEVKDWYQQILGKLIEYDRVNNTELVHTLEVYFDNSQMAQQTAYHLFIHPKTLRYRLHRIEEIVGVDPFSKDQQLNFHIATKLARLVNITE